MRILIFGASGFIGRNLAKEMKLAGHDVKTVGATPDSSIDFAVDLLDLEGVKEVIDSSKPEVIFNCAGIVKNTEESKANVLFSTNIINACKGLRYKLYKLIVMGSAAEYGIVDEPAALIDENYRRLPVSEYGKSKKSEVDTAIKLCHDNSIPLVVARIFNPIGPKMNDKFLVMNLLRQVSELVNGKRDVLEVNRLDAQRDYIHVSDVVHALRLLAESSKTKGVYNVGSGIQTSNEEIVDIIAEYSKISRPKVNELAKKPEPCFASRADCRKLKTHTSWVVKHSIRQILEEIIHENGLH